MVTTECFLVAVEHIYTKIGMFVADLYETTSRQYYEADNLSRAMRRTSVIKGQDAKSLWRSLPSGHMHKHRKYVCTLKKPVYSFDTTYMGYHSVACK